MAAGTLLLWSVSDHHIGDLACGSRCRANTSPAARAGSMQVFIDAGGAPIASASTDVFTSAPGAWRCRYAMARYGTLPGFGS